MQRKLSILAFVLMFTLLSVWTVQPAPALAVTDDTKVTASQNAGAEEQAQSRLVAEKSDKKKPWYKSRTAKIVGGSAGAGALVGALVGGGKGAAAGAVVGGGAGYVYDRKTRKNKR